MNRKEMNAKMITSLCQGFSNTYLLYTACKLGIFDLIGRGVNTAAELSRSVKAEERILQKFLRPLVAYDFLTEKDSFYRLTEAGRLLTEDEDGSLKGYVLYCGGICAKSWSVMAEAAVQGVVPYSLATGKELFLENEKDENHYGDFNNMMNFVSESMALSEFLSDVEKADVKNIVDVGGGTGAVIIQFLRHFPDAVGKIMDLEFVREKAEDHLRKNGLEGRCSFAAGDFFEPFTAPADIFILSRVLHDWGDEDALKILKNVRKNMTEGSRLYIIEMVVPQEIARKNLGVYIIDLQIWAICGGMERTMEEYSKLIEAAGLTCRGCSRLSSGESVLEIRRSDTDDGGRDETALPVSEEYRE